MASCCLELYATLNDQDVIEGIEQVPRYDSRIDILN